LTEFGIRSLWHEEPLRSKKICFSIVMFRMEMVAPGIKKETFNLELHDNILTISYDHEDNREGARRDLKYRTSEYNYHSFSRSFSLPETVESEKFRQNTRMVF
jgi:HSP20 family protein